MIFRIRKTNDYTIICNHVFRNNQLSYKAKGLLVEMLSMPDDWKFSTQDLIQRAKDGRDAVYSAIKELEDAGYLKREKATNEKGQFMGYDYNVYEKPDAENPDVEKPHRENPYTENPSLLITNGSKDNVSTKVETVRENNTPSLFEDNIGDTTPYNPPTTSEQEQMFDEFRRAYRGTKRGLRTEFENFRKKHKDWRDVLVHLLADYQRQVQVLDANKAAGAFVPQPKNLQTYINQRCWEEEITLLTPQTQSDYARQSFDREVAKQRGQIAARATTRRAVLDAAIQSINAERGITPDY